jgi:hypothetical protein
MALVSILPALQAFFCSVCRAFCQVYRPGALALLIGKIQR